MRGTHIREVGVSEVNQLHQILSKRAAPRRHKAVAAQEHHARQKQYYNAPLQQQQV
jgi:hypothetical protein